LYASLGVYLTLDLGAAKTIKPPTTPLQSTMACHCLRCHPAVVECKTIGNMKSHMGATTLAHHKMGAFVRFVAWLWGS
jgi:hypothetical protein